LGVRDGVYVTRRWWLLLGGVLVVAGLGWWVLTVTQMDPTERSTASSYGQFVLAAVGLLTIIGDWIAKSFTRAAEPDLDQLADLLAEAMRNQWEDAAKDRRLLQPAPLPIRWCRDLPHRALPHSATAHPIPGRRPSTTPNFALSARSTNSDTPHSKTDLPTGQCLEYALTSRPIRPRKTRHTKRRDQL
jgi:hypothetical protein